jgi:polysaccharide biosynthesis/export protein
MMKKLVLMSLLFVQFLNASGCTQCGDMISNGWFEYDEQGARPIYPEKETESDSLQTTLLPPKADYRLKSGDTLLIDIYGEANTQKQVIVDPRGMVSYLFISAVPALGKTISELRQDLEKRLNTYYRNVVLSITPMKFGAAFYTISGEVNEPGRKPVIGNPTVLSAIGQAGGFTLIEWREQLIDLSDLEHAFLARNGSYVPVDFVRLVREGDLSQDIPLMEGDYIYIPNRQVKQVFVLGETYRSAAISYFDHISLAEAIAEAGDVTARASSRVLVIRGSLACPVKFLVHYTKIVKGRTCDFPLMPGDIVFVPPRRLQKLREIFYSALNTFVATVAAVAGQQAFIKIHPHAAGDDDLFFGDAVILP